MPAGKSPGPDGYTAKFYKVLCPDLSPSLLAAFNSVSTDSPPPPAFLRAFITVIPKEGKDPALCPSYRPISLINNDAKLFAKLIANRLADHMCSLIHPDQVGFVRGREARDNTLRAFTLVHCARSRKTPLLLLSLDAEKAFDRVDWGFLRATLSQIGLGHVMEARIMALYSCPQAQVRLNGQLSSPFSICNGTRQGCPLSPLLYVLCMEHLLVDIRKNPDIRGLSLPSGHYKCSAYADDLLLFLTSPVTSLPSLLSTLRTFSAHSNYKLNASKSEALDVSLPAHLRHTLQTSYPFKWQTRSLKYLGIQVPADPVDTYRVNFPPLLQTLRSDLARWGRGDFSWIGRVNIFKMNVLPRLLYLFSGVPVHMPRSFFREVSTLQIGFVWAGKHPRLARNILIRRKREGGLALPDPLAYYLAAVLTRVLDSFHHTERKQWVSMETVWSAVDPRSLLWCPKGSLPSGSSPPLPPIMHSISHARLTYLRKSSLFSSDGPLTPLFGNKDFQPAFRTPSFLSFTKSEGTTLRSLLTSTTLKPLDDILGDSPPSLLHALQYSQLHHFYKANRLKLDLHRVPTQFERLCISPSPPSRPVSALYALILDDFTSRPLPFRLSWEKELGHSLDDWAYDLSVCHRLAISCKLQETNYKIMTRWYRVPALLSRIYTSVPDVCWRCGAPGGTMLHIWLTCPVLDPFWSQAIDLMSRLLSTTVPKTPELLLLSILPPSFPRHLSRLLHFFLTAARAVIPRLWRSSSPPTLSSWLREVSHLSKMEELTADTKHQLDKFHSTWSHWIDFMSSPNFLTYT